MLLDCAKLTHWKVEEAFNEMFEFKRDYMKWVCLKYEDPATIGLFENEWNDFDHLTEKTRMLHTTKRRHQPWKTGLPVDFLAARPTLYSLLDRLRDRDRLRLDFGFSAAGAASASVASVTGATSSVCRSAGAHVTRRIGNGRFDC